MVGYSTAEVNPVVSMKSVQPLGFGSPKAPGGLKDSWRCMWSNSGHGLNRRKLAIPSCRHSSGSRSLMAWASSKTCPSASMMRSLGRMAMVIPLFLQKLRPADSMARWPMVLSAFRGRQRFPRLSARFLGGLRRWAPRETPRSRRPPRCAIRRGGLRRAPWPRQERPTEPPRPQRLQPWRTGHRRRRRRP